jgi:hypothetical protein
MEIVFAACFRLKRVSEMMRTGIIVLIPKVGDLRDLSNWRPVTKVSRALSVMESVLKLRLYPHMGDITATDQFSAAPGRDMTHAIVSVLDAVEFAASPQSPAIVQLQRVLQLLHMILLDQTKGFDRSDRSLLVRMIALYCGLVIPCRDDPTEDPAAIQALVEAVDFLLWIQIVIGDEPLQYPHRRRVLVNGRLSAPLDLLSGCPQGAILAALLFNCGTVEGLGALLHAAGLEGLKVRNDRGDIENFTTSRFADDLVLIVSDGSVHAAMDAIDVYACGSGGAANVKKTLGMTLTPQQRACPGPGGTYAGDVPTYVPPGAPPDTEPRSRLRWLRPNEAVGRVLGINAGPAATPGADWDVVETAFFTQIRIWQQHNLSRDGAQYVLSTYVFSRTWFLGRFRPPTKEMTQRLDRAATLYYWKRSLSDTAPGQPLRRFRVGHRVKRAELAMDRHHGGIGWFLTEHIFTAMHAGMVVQWMYPAYYNTRDGGARWQTSGRAAITLALGSMAGLCSHPDIARAARRARNNHHSIPLHWEQYLIAWAQMRHHYRVATPSSCEEVLSMPLFDSEVRYRGNALRLTISPAAGPACWDGCRASRDG